MLVPFVIQVTQRKISATEKDSRPGVGSADRYATATGRLPCPATAASSGAEDFAPTGNAANGICESFRFPAGRDARFHTDQCGSFGNRRLGDRTKPNHAIKLGCITAARESESAELRVHPQRRYERSASGRIAGARLLYVCSNGSTAVAATPTCGAGAVIHQQHACRHLVERRKRGNRWGRRRRGAESPS